MSRARRIAYVVAGLFLLFCAVLFAALHISLQLWIQTVALLCIGMVLISWGLRGDHGDGSNGN